MRHPVENYVRAMIDLYNAGVSTAQLTVLFPWDIRSLRRLLRQLGKRPKKKRYHPIHTERGMSRELLSAVLKRYGMTLGDLCDFQIVPTPWEMDPIIREIKKRPRRSDQSRQGAQLATRK